MKFLIEFQPGIRTKIWYEIIDRSSEVSLKIVQIYFNKAVASDPGPLPDEGKLRSRLSTVIR